MARNDKMIVALAVVIACALSARANAAERTPDGRFHTHCYQIGDGSNDDLCSISFYRLIANPEDYDGRLLFVTGYLVKLFGRLVLFANESSFDSGVDVEGVTLIGGKIPNDVSAHVTDGIWPVFVIGRFDAHFTDDPLPRLGAIRDIRRVGLMPRDNGRRPNGSGGE